MCFFAHRDVVYLTRMLAMVTLLPNTSLAWFQWSGSCLARRSTLQSIITQHSVVGQSQDCPASNLLVQQKIYHSNPWCWLWQSQHVELVHRVERSTFRDEKGDQQQGQGPGCSPLFECVPVWPDDTWQLSGPWCYRGHLYFSKGRSLPSSIRVIFLALPFNLALRQWALVFVQYFSANDTKA